LARTATDETGTPAWGTIAHDARSLASGLPEILIGARRAAQTVAHGLHGRRRSGPGETFWQFRRFLDGEPAVRVDWRRSARDDTLYVREKEWEAAHTVFMWPDRSRSMAFRSALGHASKRDRALVLTLALSELLVEGGERVALLGLTRPSSSRSVVRRMAEALANEPEADRVGLPEGEALPRFSEFLVVSDLLDPAELIETRLSRLAAGGARGHLLMVLDPIEETFPFEGRIEFLEAEGAGRFLAGRAETYRAAYLERLAAHKARLAAFCARLGWTFMTHHTDRPAHEPLLMLHAVLTEPAFQGAGKGVPRSGAGVGA